MPALSVTLTRSFRVNSIKSWKVMRVKTASLLLSNFTVIDFNFLDWSQRWLDMFLPVPLVTPESCVDFPQTAASRLKDPSGDFLCHVPLDGSRRKNDARLNHNKRLQEERKFVMACTRCGGLIVKEPVYDMEGSSQLVLMDRCLQCGNIEDPVSARNRANSSLAAAQKGKVRRVPERPRPPLELTEG